LAKHRRLLIGIPALASVATLLATLLMPNVYMATARTMPPLQSQSAAFAALGSLGGIVGGPGPSLGQALGLRNPSELYVGILRGDTVSDRIIERFKLKKLYDVETMVEARKELASVTSMGAGREGLITISVEDEDPVRAADMANAFVSELDDAVKRLAVTEAAQRRLFFERELKDVRKKLSDAETALKLTQQSTGLIQPEGQAKAIFDAFAELRARIAAKEVELASLASFATSRNPDYVRAQNELAGLRIELSKLESARGKQSHGDILVPTEQVAEAGLEYLRRVRDVKYYETLFEILARQFEVAKIDEAKDAGLLQIVDKATPPDRKSKPRRALIAVLTGMVAFFVALLIALLREARDRALADPVQRERVHTLSRLFGKW